MDLKELENKIKQIIQTEILPILEKDGGGVEFVRFDETTNTCELKPIGNCKNCPLWLMTLRAGIERIIINAIPQIRRVESV
mgnify:CR=1 FL=1